MWWSFQSYGGYSQTSVHFSELTQYEFECSDSSGTSCEASPSSSPIRQPCAANSSVNSSTKKNDMLSFPLSSDTSSNKNDSVNMPSSSTAPGPSVSNLEVYLTEIFNKPLAPETLKFFEDEFDACCPSSDDESEDWRDHHLFLLFSWPVDQCCSIEHGPQRFFSSFLPYFLLYSFSSSSPLLLSLLDHVLCLASLSFSLLLYHYLAASLSLSSPSLFFLILSHSFRFYFDRCLSSLLYLSWLLFFLPLPLRIEKTSGLRAGFPCQLSSSKTVDKTGSVISKHFSLSTVFVKYRLNLRRFYC